MNNLRKKPELLCPASSLEVLKTAFYYGADAVYIGGEMYSLRARAKNFSMSDIKEGIEFANKLDKKVYITDCVQLRILLRRKTNRTLLCLFMMECDL